MHDMDESNTKFCRYCQEEMNKQSKFCAKCQHYQFSLFNLHRWGFLLTALIVPGVVWLSTIAHNSAKQAEDALVSNCEISVSYTHLTLPTTPYV